MTMNIKEAKEQIKNAMTAYFTKDEFGSYAVPVEKQRPVFLMGPPGIGKTAIMEQIAQELDVCLVSYSMTHHTRQSALGLPFIEKKVFNGKEYQVSEYTMSEILSSVYRLMERTGLQEGILFLDEINCVSETLAPSMLQFLQYKIFGRHRVPEGWIVVTAGNPPEYNRSVREFDIVTWDRLKRIDVEPDFDAWKEFAYQKHVHPAVMTYLKDVKAALTAPEADLAALLEEQLRRQKTRIDTGRRSGSLSQEAERSHRRIIAALERQKALVGQTVDSQTGFAAVKADFDQMVQGLKAQAKTAGEMLNNLFAFCEEVFPEGQELLILVTELTINYYAATFISRYGCDAYFTHNQELLFYERQQEIISQLESLELN